MISWLLYAVSHNHLICALRGVTEPSKPWLTAGYWRALVVRENEQMNSWRCSADTSN